MAEILATTPLARRADPGGNGSEPDIASPPRGLSAASRRFWRSVTERWALDVASLQLLEMHVRAMDRYAAADREIRRDGPTVIVDGKVKAHPAHSVLRDNLREARQLLRQLNLEVGE
jgi:phage terminase small subunit